MLAFPKLSDPRYAPVYSVSNCIFNCIYVYCTSYHCKKLYIVTMEQVEVFLNLGPACQIELRTFNKDEIKNNILYTILILTNIFVFIRIFFDVL